MRTRKCLRVFKKKNKKKITKQNFSVLLSLKCWLQMAFPCWSASLSRGLVQHKKIHLVRMKNSPCLVFRPKKGCSIQAHQIAMVLSHDAVPLTTVSKTQLSNFSPETNLSSEAVKCCSLALRCFSCSWVYANAFVETGFWNLHWAEDKKVTR